MNAIGLYIDLPFCIQRCSFCSFSVRSYREREASRYLSALLKEIHRVAADFSRPRIATAYLGGGTPSLYSTAALNTLFDLLHRSFEVAPDIEITIEVHPATVNRNTLAHLRSLGINRLSVGVQSLKAEDLQGMGRRYSPGDVERLVLEARAVGFENIAMDLIYALPGQSVLDWAANLEKILRLGPDHLSVYGLSIEPGTLWGRMWEEGSLSLASEDEEIEMYSLAQSMLKGENYDHYEISNYARPGHRCRHNLLYWEGGSYLGVGLSAHSFSAGNRWSNSDELSEYLYAMENGGLPVTFRETLSDDQFAREQLVFGLRKIEGIRLSEAAKQLLGGPIASLLKTGLLVIQDGILRLSGHGILMADEVAIRLM